MKNFKLYLLIFSFISIIELFIYFSLWLIISFYHFELFNLEILNENTFKNIRGFFILNLFISLLYFLLYKIMNLGFYNSSAENES